MPVGLEVMDDKGRVQIIDKAPLLSFKDTKVVSGDTNNRYLTDKHLLAAKPSNGNKLLLTNFAVSNDIDTIDNQRYAFRTVGLGSFFRFEYGVQPTSSSEKYGLELYNEQGILIFSSSQKPIALLDIVTIPDIRNTAKNINGNITYWSKDYGMKDVAVITVQYPIWSSGSNIMTAAAVKRDRVMAIEQVVEWTDSQLVPGLITSWSASYLIIDITNY